MESLSCLFSMNPHLQLSSSSLPLPSIPTRALPLASSSTSSSPQRKTLRTSSSPPKPLKPSSSSTISAQTISTSNTLQKPSAPTKKVLVPIGFGTEEMEAVVLIDVLRRAGADVTVASVEPQLQIEASWGVKLVADTYISKCSTEIFDLVALPFI